MKQISDYIVVQNALDKDYCNHLITSLEQKKWISHQWSNDQGQIVGSRNNKELEILPAGEEQKFLQDVIIKCCENYKAKHNIHSWITALTTVRFNKYKVGTNMNSHVDHIHSIFDGKKKGIPIISVVGVLNDNYTGGEFIFNEEYDIKLKQGDILLFPSNFLYSHRVKDVKEGIRYSFVSWGF